jgi:hypothetical protein
MDTIGDVIHTVAPLAPLLLALGEGDMETKPYKRGINRKIIERGGNIKASAKKGAKKLIEVATDKMVKKLGGRAPSARGAIVKQIMKEHGLSLPKASAFVKEHGLY